MKTILFATDFSDSCYNAFQYLKEIIVDDEVKVDIINVYDIPVTTLLAISHNAVKGMIEERKSVVVDLLHEQMQELPENARGEIYARYGTQPSTEISQVSGKKNYALVVMALRQKYSLFDRIIGTVTAQTINQTSVPVLAIPNGAKFQPIENILFPTNIIPGEDLSPNEEDAMLSLHDFWSMSNSPVINLIHVSPDNENLDVIHKKLVFKNIDFIHTHARSVEDGLFSYFNRSDAQMLAFYKPERSFWERLYHSSLTRKILYKSRIPVIVFS